MNIICKNCNAHFKGNYCPHCSQKAGTGRLKLAHVLHEFWHNFTHTDKGYLSLVAALTVRPGVVIREFIEGKRKKYFNPYTFFLVTTALLIFIANRVFKYEDKLSQYNNEYGQYLNLHYNIIVLCSVPVLALLLQLIFVKRHYNYAEWVTFLVFAYGLINFYQVIFQLLYFPLIKYHAVLSQYTTAIGYVMLGYVLVKFIEPRKWWQWLQCIFVTLLIYYFVELIASLIALRIYGVPDEKLIRMFKQSFSL